jgi:adenosylmethionine-8-amino-7-oxononanoate aminotransferase
LLEENLFDRVPIIAERIGGGLSALAATGAIVEARGVGGIWSAELQPGFAAPAVRNEMLKHGVIARPVGLSVIAFCPPFVTTETQLDQCVVALSESIAALS